MVEPAPDGDPEQWRAATLQILAWLAIVIGSGLLIAAALTVKDGVWISGTALAVLLALAIPMRLRRLSLRVRGACLTGVCLVVGALTTTLLGPVPASILLIPVAAMVGMLFVGIRAALLAMVLGCLNFMVLGILYRAQIATRLPGELVAVGTWVRMSATIGLLTTLLVLTLGRTLIRMESSLHAARAALARARDEQQARERAEADRHASQEQLRMTIEAAAVATWSYDVTVQRLTWSQNLSAVLGLPEAALPRLRDDILALVHADDRARLATRLAVRTTDPVGPVELRLQLPGGRVLWTESRWRVVPGAAGDQVLGVLTDVTDRRRAQDSQRLREAALEASRVKSSFVANMSHEIRTPLNAVVAFTHLASLTPLSDQQRGYVTGIRTASESLMAVINDVLDLSKIEAGKLTLSVAPFLINDLRVRVESVLAVQAAHKGVALRFIVGDDVPTMVAGDLHRLGQVLINLGGNALKFTEQGEVEIALTRVGPDGDQVIVKFSIRDTGIGMTPAQVARLFEPFTQATESTAQQFGGTGLGLVISQRIVTHLGGHIQADSAAGRGTTFTFSLALRKAQPGQAAAPQRPVLEPRPLVGLRLLVVDDAEINRAVAREVLELAGATVALACDGDEAVRAVASADPPYSAVLMDVQMPVMGGLEATRLMRATPSGKSLPIVALSAHAFDAERRKCLDAGMTEYVAKPFEPNELIALLLRLATAGPTQAWHAERVDSSDTASGGG